MSLLQVTVWKHATILATTFLVLEGDNETFNKLFEPLYEHDVF
jgi:hypothetical protein